MDGIIKSKPVQVLLIVLTLVATSAIYPHAFAQYQYKEDHARIIFSSSNSTQSSSPHLSSNIIISSNGYSNSTHITIPSVSSNPKLSSDVHSNSPQATAKPAPTSAVPEFGPIAPIIFVISVIAIVVLNAKTRFFSITHSGGT